MKTKPCQRVLLATGAMLALVLLNGCALLRVADIVLNSDSKKEAEERMKNGTAVSMLRLSSDQNDENANRQIEAIEAYNRTQDYKQQAGYGGAR